MLLLGVKNSTAQDVAVGGLINLGQTYRKYCKKNNCGIKTFDFAGTSVSLNHSGVYHITTTLVGNAPAAGDVTVQLYINGVEVPGAISTQTITTADTEVRTFVIDYYTLVDNACILGRATTVSDTITLVNVGVAAEFTNVILNVEKVV